jgi:protein involved in polysaccharide export with SLBB domain
MYKTQLNLPGSFLTLILFLICVLSSSTIHSQALSPLAEDFLEGLPPSVREEIDVQNSVQKEDELQKLFRSDTSIEKNKVILRNLQEQLKALQQRLEQTDGEEKDNLQRFGDSFFQSFQSSFMPVNVPNIGGDYIVDVGDSFTFERVGKKTDKGELAIGRDGSLLIPGSGKIQVAGRTLTQVEEKVASLMEETQIGTNHTLSLKILRDVQIIIVGGVENPGIYTLSGGSNVLGGLHVAGGISETGSFRNVELRRNGKTIATFDLYKLFVSGEYEGKNTLRSGDTIFVNPVNFQVPLVGGIHNSAIYELKNGENLSNVISFAGGFDESFYGFQHVFVSRNTIGARSIIKINLDELNLFKMVPRDSVMIPSYSYESIDTYKITIEGQVKFPGTYYVYPGATLLSTLQLAGGYKESAYEFGSALLRKSASDEEKKFAQKNYADTVNFIVSNIGKPGANIDPDVLSLLAEEVRSRSYEGRVITEFDLNKLSKNSSLDVELSHNDRIVIPRLEKVVYAFGDFKNPANFTYHSNLNVKDYIELAGGLKDSADTELIIIDPDGKTQVYTKRFFANNSIDIYPGSIIYAQREISKIQGVQYAATISPILSSLAISLASLNSISN